MTSVGTGSGLLSPSDPAHRGWSTRRPTRWGHLLAEHGPGAFDSDAVARWLARWCSGPAPVRQGFAAVLVAPDGSLVAGVSPRAEVVLFYAASGDSLVLGTHPRHVIAALPRPPALDLGKLADLVTLHDARDTTPYDGVLRLPLGHRLTWRPQDGPPVVRRWFDLDTTPDRSLTTLDAVRLMRETVTEAVAASLPAHGDVSATLSGGLDSAMVVGTAATLLEPQGRTVHTVTHRPIPGAATPAGDWEPDDGPYAERMCAELRGLTWTPLVNTARRSHFAALPDLFDRTWLPTLNPANALWVDDAVLTAEARGSSVLLTGATGNAPYSRDAGQPLRELAHRHRYDLLVRHARSARRAGARWPAAVRPVVSASVPSWLRTARDRARAAATAPGPAAQLMAGLPVRAERLSAAALAERRRLSGGSGTLTRQDWVDFMLRDHSMLTIPQHLSPSVWWSDPLSDPEVTTLAFRLPAQAWLAGGRSRGLAREASRGRVPDHIRLRTTRGGQAMDRGRWLVGREQELRDHLDVVAASPAAQQFLDLPALRRGVESFDPTGPDVEMWDLGMGRALGFGLFAAWYESSVLAAPSGATGR